MLRTSLNGGTARTALLIAAGVAGLGYFIYSRLANSDAFASGVRGINDGFRRRLDRAGMIVGQVQWLQTPARVTPRKISTEEPMAGYGA